MKEGMTLRFDQPIGPSGGKVQAVGPGGERFELTLTPADVHTSEELSSYAAGYKPGAFRADEIAPVVPVDASNFKYRTFGSDDAFLHVDAEVSLTSDPHLVDPSSSVGDGATKNYYVGSLIPVQTEDQAAFAARRVAVKRCMNAILLDREKRLTDIIETNTNWAAAVRHTLGAGENWDGGASSAPITKLQTALEASVQQVTGIWSNPHVAHAFLRHDQVKDHMRQFLGDKGAMEMGDGFNDFRIPGFPAWHVLPGKVRTAAAGTLSYLLANHVVLVCTPPGVPEDGEEISSLYTFRERGEDGVGINVREWFVSGKGIKGATMVAVSMAERIYMTGSDCGGHIATVVSA